MAPLMGAMKRKDAEEIIACLPRGRTLFYYFKDRYALMLLADYVQEGKPVREVKASRFGRLLARPVVKGLVARLGDGVLTREALESVWPGRPECYLLTLDTWGEERSRRWLWERGDYQTTRRGANLVLQLNFSSKHNQAYEELIDPTEFGPFEYIGHPTSDDGHHTLAWARLDVELDLGEALVEEVQTDWVRLVASSCRMAGELGSSDKARLHAALERRGIRRGPVALTRYAESVFRPHAAQWDEAVLAAALWFLRNELGLPRIFYHTFESGNRLKGISGGYKPPRSVYTALPRKFCFAETAARPGFLSQGKTRRGRSARAPSRFYLLN